MINNKKTAASGGNASDGTTKNGIDIIAHALANGKSAVYLKRDGWTMMPQLPDKEGDYLTIKWMPAKETKVHLYISTAFAIKAANKVVCHCFDNVVCWRPAPVIEDWMVKAAEEEAAKC